MKTKVMILIGAMLVSVIGFSQFGDINLASFSAKIDFATGLYPSVAVGDIDGDGKPDMVTANGNSNTISVFRNTSSNGSISFAARVDFIAESSPNSLTVVDIDGDGKPDVIVANGGYTISVFRNTSNSDNISFAARVDFAAGQAPNSIAISDIDGDGRLDVVMANTGSNTVSIFRNQIVITSISKNYQAENRGIIFTLYPNPFTEYVNVKGLDGETIRVVNINGQTVYSTTSNETELRINTSSWLKGVYLVNLTSKSGNTKNFKIIK